MSCLCLILLLLIASVHASVTITRDDSPVTYESTNFPYVNFSSPLCGSIFILPISSGCSVDLSTAPVPFPPVIFVPLEAIQTHCLSYSQIFAQLPPKADPESVSVLLVATTEISLVTPWNSPIGDQMVVQEIAETGYGFQMVTKNVAKKLQLAAESKDHTCVTSDLGAWPTFFQSGGFLAYVIILSLLYISFGLAAVYRLYLAVKQAQLYPIGILANLIVMTIIRVLETAVDYQNHKNLLTFPGYIVMYYMSLAFYIASYTCLVMSWCRVIQSGLESHTDAKLVKVIRVSGLINFVAVLCFFVFAIAYSISGRIPALNYISNVFMAVVAATIFSVAVSFLILCAKILRAIRKTMTVKSSALFKVTLFTIGCVSSMIVSIIVLVVYLIYSVTDAVCSFESNLALHVLRDFLQLIFLIGVVLAFVIHSFESSTHPTKNSERTTDKAAPERASFSEGVDGIILDLRKGSEVSIA